jgi:nitrogen fixation protein NifB
LKCNIGCDFCDRKVASYYHTSRPGLTSRILEPEECNDAIKAAIEKNPAIEVVGISGPGEPLFNEETFETLSLVSHEFPNLKLCVCTNGLLLPEKVRQLSSLGVRSITMTMNAVDPVIGAKINSHIVKNGIRYNGLEGARILLENQLQGLEMAVDLGMVVKVNTVLIPGINMKSMRNIAEEITSRGTFTMNIMPLIPLGGFKDLRAPTCEELISAREQCEPIIPIFRMCKQCRADACGVPGIDEK